ncbi:MAG: protein kinase, partial [Myxococcales bacterium]|nr:protein kinase [Myxococcales bacterium]
MGSGSLGQVFLAVGAGGDPVALKRFDHAWSRDLNFARDVTQELVAARQVSHAVIAQLFDEGRDGDQLYAVYECVAGQRLPTVLKRARLENRVVEPELLVHLAAKLARGLRDIHEAPRSDDRTGFLFGRLAFRDLMLTYDGHLKILGLGQSKARGMVPPSPKRLPYMAPEVLSGAEPTVRSDLFSVAAIVYEIASSRPAFKRGDEGATSRAIRRGDLTPLRPGQVGIDSAVLEVTMQALLPRAEARPASANAFTRALDRANGLEDSDATSRLTKLMEELFRDENEGFRRMSMAIVPDGIEQTVDMNGEEGAARKVRVQTDDLLTQHMTGVSTENIAGPGEQSPASADLAPDETGSGQRVLRIARYRVGRRIEADGPLQMCLAVDPNLGREVEIKVLDPSSSDARLSSEAWIRCIKQEGRYAAALQLDGVPRLLDAGRGGGLYFLVYERRAGRLLPRHLAEGRSVDAVRVIVDLATAIGRLHRAGFTLGDLRPGAVRVKLDGSVEVARLGRLHPISDGPHPLSVGGHDAPELVRDGHYDATSDQFLLGVLIYQLLTGVVPFRAQPSRPLREVVALVDPPPPNAVDPGVPEPLSRLCARLLNKDPEQRFQDMEEVASIASGAPAARPVAPSVAAALEPSLELSLAFAQLCRRVAGIATGGSSEDSVWHPDTAV